VSKLKVKVKVRIRMQHRQAIEKHPKPKPNPVLFSKTKHANTQPAFKRAINITIMLCISL